MYETKQTMKGGYNNNSNNPTSSLYFSYSTNLIMDFLPEGHLFF